MVKRSDVEKPPAKVMLYALSTCGWCKKTIDLLKDLDIDFDYVYVDLLGKEKQEDVLRTIERFNPRGSFPTIIIDNKRCIVGFDEKEISRILEE